MSGASMHASPGLPALPNPGSSSRRLKSEPRLPPPPPPPQNPSGPAFRPVHTAEPIVNGFERQEQSASDTEDAVADLEEQTFGARVPVLRALHAAAQAPVRSYKYVKVPDMELTRCLTSILAEPLSFDQDGRPRSAVRLGLDLAVSTGDLPAVRDEALAQIVAVLPDAEIASFLIEKYFNELDYDFRVLDPVAFRVEHERFVEMVQQGRQALVDPLWIGVFCMVLALALDAFWSRPKGHKDLSLFRGLSEADLRDLPSVWHDAALRALQLGEWGGTPRLRTIQCIILFGQYIQISSSSGQQGRFLGWAASAFRVAQRMSLHRLGSDPQIMPVDDPAVPPGKNSLKREMAVRLCAHLCNIDAWLSDSPCFRCYVLHPSQYNTARPLNLNLSDLSRTDWRTPPPAPLHVYTDASFQLVQCKIAEQIRRALDELVLSGKRFSYEAVLQQDAAWRRVLDGIPEVYLQPAGSPGQTTRISYERACILEDVYSRIVRLNRPFLGRGYNEGSPYRASREKCVEAAKALILSNFDMLQIETSRWWMYTGTLASSIVLMMDIFHAIDHDQPESQIREKREILGKARVIFESEVSTPALTVVVEEGRKILGALALEEERRRTTKAAHDMAAAPLPPLETFSQVLKRISREVAAQDVLQHPGSTSGPPSSTGDGPVPFAPEPPFSFARAAATAMAKTPMLDASATPFPHAYEGGAPAPDYSAFVNTLVSEDWTAGTFTSPAGDEASLLDQLAATW
ncbi:hypothetical protein JCM8202v2_005164 [Rhodotorula sphaerocarpa]